MKYKTFKIDCTIEERAKNHKMTVNEYIYHLTRLNDEHTSEHSEETLNKIEEIKDRLDKIGKVLVYFGEHLDKLTKNLNDRN